jgi:hypothetical protein
VVKTTRVAAGEPCRTIPLRSKDTLVSRIPRGLYERMFASIPLDIRIYAQELG